MPETSSTLEPQQNDLFLLILDGSLGHLQVFLRIMGIPTITSKKSLREFIKNEEEWGGKRRVYVTGSIETRNYLKNRNKEVILIETPTPTKEALCQLIPVLVEKGLKIDFSAPRCQNCNSKLIITYEVSNNPLIPENTKKHLHWAFYCKKCQKAYWIGSHWKRIIKTLSPALENTNVKLPKPWQPTPP